MKLTYIIPHKGRGGILIKHLEDLMPIVDDRVQVIVVNDDDPDFPDISKFKYVQKINSSGGPNKARNKGAEQAKGEYLLFVGSDTIPHKGLINEHLSAFSRGAVVTQGYTPFHHQSMGSLFMAVLDKSGIQANWGGLMKEDGTWHELQMGFCLTTNFGIKKRLFKDMGGFDEDFIMPAWDDIEFGTRLRKLDVPSNILPNAINFHVHKYTFAQYIQRQLMEGQNRWLLGMKHPEMAPTLFSPEELRKTREIDYKQYYYTALDTFGDSQSYANTVMAALNSASNTGARLAIENKPMLNYVEFCKSPQNIFKLFMLYAAFLTKDWTFCQHSIGWLLEDDPSPYTHKLAYEFYSATNVEMLATYHKTKMLEGGLNA